ncbi:hypothetical protein Dip510_000050 [Elusimicrobium posterum]|uniref:hypothetical protein n=1 Tax=Elusimicrobium posterum TaxID=3116653 RepID=UPI003C70B92A
MDFTQVGRGIVQYLRANPPGERRGLKIFEVFMKIDEIRKLKSGQVMQVRLADDSTGYVKYVAERLLLERDSVSEPEETGSLECYFYKEDIVLLAAIIDTIVKIRDEEKKDKVKIKFEPYMAVPSTYLEAAAQLSI